jgi:hypothetical protein
VDYLQATALLMLAAVTASAPVAPQFAKSQPKFASVDWASQSTPSRFAHAPVTDRHLHARPHHINTPAHG